MFTANPEDYTNRGSIVTPLKDRIGSQIFTHYPKNIALARAITEQEAKISAEDLAAVFIPDMAKNLLEEVSFTARDSEYVDAKSGVSARLSISAMENLIAAGKLRLIETESEKTTIRLVDFMSIIPSITGKIELVYEGEQEGADEVARILIDAAIMVQFNQIFPRIAKLEKAGTKTPYSDLVHWFEKNIVELNYTDTDKVFFKSLKAIKPLTELIEKHASHLSVADKDFCMELVLWALSISDKLGKTASDAMYKFDSR